MERDFGVVKSHLDFAIPFSRLKRRSNKALQQLFYRLRIAHQRAIFKRLMSDAAT